MPSIITKMEDIYFYCILRSQKEESHTYLLFLCITKPLDSCLIMNPLLYYA